MKRLGILLSGRGSNFVAIADAIAAGRLDAEIAVVISNRPEAPGITAARERGLNAVVLPSAGSIAKSMTLSSSPSYDKHGVDLVCLAGYMRILSGYFIREFPHAHSEHSPVAAARVSRPGRPASGPRTRREILRLHRALCR